MENDASFNGYKNDKFTFYSRRKGDEKILKRQCTNNINIDLFIHLLLHRILKMKKEKILVETTLKGNIEQIWDFWTKPEHITQWYFASSEWHAPLAENDLRINGKFKTRMEAKDGSFGFDFEGIYTEIIPFKRIDYSLGDHREVSVTFEEVPGGVKISELFDIEDVNSADKQRLGWQSILENFKKYAE
jgi:uncharacterized protein YndB with AHSA1/START domain